VSRRARGPCALQGDTGDSADDETGRPMKKWLPLVALAGAQFIMVLDQSVMNVSISQLVADFDTTVTTIQSVITLYCLMMAMLMLAGAKIGDIIGRKRAFVIGLVIYACGSALTAAAPGQDGSAPAGALAHGSTRPTRQPARHRSAGSTRRARIPTFSPRMPANARRSRRSKLRSGRLRRRPGGRSPAGLLKELPLRFPQALAERQAPARPAPKIFTVCTTTALLRDRAPITVLSMTPRYGI